MIDTYELFCKVRQMKNWFRGIFIGSDIKPLEDAPVQKSVVREREKTETEIREDGTIILTMRGRF